MKSIHRLLVFFLSLAIAATAPAQTFPTVDFVGVSANPTTGALKGPTNFFTGNAAAITSVVGGSTITLGSTVTSLGNTTTTINGLTLGNATLTGLATITGNASVSGAITGGVGVSHTFGNGLGNTNVIVSRTTTAPSSVSLTATSSHPILAFTSDTTGGYTWGRILSNGSEVFRVFDANFQPIANVSGAGIAVAGGGYFTSDSTFAGASGTLLNVDVTSGAANPLFSLKIAGTTKAVVGVAGATNNIIAGTAVGDLAIRAATQNILLSADGGATAHLKVGVTGNVTIPSTIQTGGWSRTSSLLQVNTYGGASGVNIFRQNLAADPGTLAAGDRMFLYAPDATVGLRIGTDGASSLFNFSPTGNLTVASSISNSNNNSIFVRDVAGTGAAARLFADTSNLAYVDATQNTSLNFQVGAGTKAVISNTGVFSISPGGALAIAGTSSVTGIRTATATYNFGTISAGAVADTTVSVTGAAVGSTVTVNTTDATMWGAVVPEAQITALNTVTVRLRNDTGSVQSVGSRSFRVTVISF